jgi:nucleoside 2-deoxyribosyltransferase
MADVFISYAQENQAKADALASALRQEGWSVFHDRTIPPGQRWDEYIGRELESARCVVVLWSVAACASSWVLEEAEDARQRGILVPTLIETRLPPLGFRRIQAADLVDWNRRRDHHQFQQLLLAIRRLAPVSAPDGSAEQDLLVEGRPAASPALPLGPEPRPSAVDRQAQPLEQVFMACAVASEQDRSLANGVKALLASHEISVVTSQETDAGPKLIELVRQRVVQSDGVVALLTRRDKLKDGGWTTHAWPVDELAFALRLGKPAVALVEDGVRPRLEAAGAELIGYRPKDPLRAILDLSHVIGTWKTRAGRILKVSIEPTELARSLVAGGAGSCRYRVVLHGDPGEWRPAVPIREADGAFLYLAVPQRGSLVQVEVVDGASTWRSSVVAEHVPIHLARV